ncbi:MAG: D-alanyl-D-alanine dipeptidase [Polaribacter sp. SA4-10]|nr:MAG: D-alanyl-D-alanine dipeptidase [Polaribacter sp. SA4-10]
MNILYSFLFVSISYSVTCQNLPKGFVYLSTIDNSIRKELRYFTNNNFIGKPIKGYKKNILIVSERAAKALKKIQNELLKDSMSLKVFDAYRPQQAVDHFVEWAKDLNDTLMKKIFYPKVPKKKLFELGFIAEKSGHTRGSSVDLTIIDLKTNEELDMGSIYDFFGIESHPCSKKININQQNNRLFLRTIMLQNNFSPYENEWWHFTLKNEPFSQRYFNFPIR